jgi:hypothetical protein
MSVQNLAVLKHLIDVASSRSMNLDCKWLGSEIINWCLAAVVPDIGWKINSSWSTSQIAVFAELVNQACLDLSRREFYMAPEIASWVLLDDLAVYSRCEAQVYTAPIMELGQAIIALVNHYLPKPPVGKQWIYGAPEGRTTTR